MTPAKSTKCFAYLRVSGKGQIEGDGFPRQRAAVDAYARANGLRIVRYFQEEGVSGTKELDDRPALTELMVALLADGVRTVIIEKLDRLARDLMVQETLIADFRKHGFTLISASEPDLCSDEPTRVLMRQLFGVIAQYEKTTIVHKLRAARERMRNKTGRCEGRKPYGAREGEQEVISLIRELSARGMNYTAIAEKLNTDGVSTRGVSTRSGAKCKWYPANIGKIINRAA